MRLLAGSNFRELIFPCILVVPGPPSSQAFWWNFMVQLILRKIYTSFVQVVLR